MAKKGVKKSRRETVKPVNVIKLMDFPGVRGADAAHMIGTSTTTIYKAINPKVNAISKAYELAAITALEELRRKTHEQTASAEETETITESRPAEVQKPAPPSTPSRSNDVMFMVTLPVEKVDMFQRMVNAMGGVAMSA